MMLRKLGPGVCRWPTLLLWRLYVCVEEHTVYGHNRTEETREMERPFYEQGDYQGFDGTLGLCLCKEPPERAVCGGWCRSRLKLALHLVCAAVDLQPVYSNSEGQVSISGSVLLETVFKRWDSQGTLQCDGRHNVSLPLYTVQTSVFLKMQGSLVSSMTFQRRFRSYFQRKAWEHTSQQVTLVSERKDGLGLQSHHLGRNHELQLCGDSEPYCMSTSRGHTALHCHQYDVENLYNTNRDFDWGPLRRLAEDLTLARTPPTLFSMVFTQPGVYAVKLSGHQYKHKYVRVMPAGGQCYEAGPFLPTVPHHVTRMSIAKRRHLFLRPDWLVTGGLLVGAVVILSLCVTLLILFREYGWPEKVATRARYRSLQLQYPMEDYSSKGSRVTTLKKHHRNLQARMTEASVQPVTV
ncbi:hypothetical protein J4Q44_G00333360 [Coregonus suidteri]|uniref:Uncharacterized protein n=1 Tax=Coregonus suidteri TaxID=861788 RepID=A0AAN8QGG5_9TELE